MRIPFNNHRERIGFYSLLTIALLAAVVGIPAATFIVTHREFERLAERAALAYARSVLQRSDRISVEIEQELAALEAERRNGPCSQATIRLMRRIALGSVDIMLIGYQQDDRLLCSSFGYHEGGLPLGPVSFRGDFNMRRNVQLELAPGAQFNAGERDGWIFFLEQAQAIDVAIPSNIALATFSVRAQRLRTARGSIRPEWIAKANAAETAFIDGDDAIGVVKSETYASGAIAAVPLAIFASSRQGTELVATSVAILAGLSIATWILYVARQYRMISPLSLRRALRRNEFHMAYQPIVDLRSRQWIGAEALMRWRRADTDISPELFFAAAENNRMAPLFTKKMLTLVAQDAPAIFAADDIFYLSLNLTASDIEGAGLVSDLQRLAAQCGVPPSRFKIEVTERSALDGKDVKDTLEAIRRNGVETMIDDFGAGFSNLKCLSTFTFDFLKIDRAFTEGLSGPSISSDVTLHIVRLATSLGIGLVAEGVENERQAEFLSRNGVRYGQGWLLAKPRVAAELAKDLTERCLLRSLPAAGSPT